MGPHICDTHGTSAFCRQIGIRKCRNARGIAGGLEAASGEAGQGQNETQAMDGSFGTHGSHFAELGQVGMEIHISVSVEFRPGAASGHKVRRTKHHSPTPFRNDQQNDLEGMGKRTVSQAERVH